MTNGIEQILAAPFKILTNVGYAVAGVGEGDKELFKKGLRGTVNGAIDVPTGALNFAGNCLDALRPGEYRVDTVSDAPSGCKGNCNCDRPAPKAPEVIPMPSLDGEMAKLQDAIDRAGKADEKLNQTIDKAEKTDDKLNDTIARAEELNRRLQENLDKAPEQDDVPATPVAPVEPSTPPAPSGKGNWIPLAVAGTIIAGVALAILGRGKLKGLFSKLFKKAGKVADDVPKTLNTPKTPKLLNAPVDTPVIPARASVLDDTNARVLIPEGKKVLTVKTQKASEIKGAKIRTQDEIDIINSARSRRMNKAQRKIEAQKAHEARKLKNAQKVKEKEAKEKLEAINRAETKKAVERAKRKNQKKVEQRNYSAAKKRNAELTKQADEQNKVEMTKLRNYFEQKYAKKVENPHINNVNRNPEAARDIKQQLDEMAVSTANPIKNNEFPRELLSGGNVGKPMGTLDELRPDLAAELDKLKLA